MKHYPPRRRFTQEKQNMRLTVITVVAIIGLIIFFIIFGIPALSSIGSLIGGFKNEGNTTQTVDDTVVLEPILDPPPTATNTATVSITGSGTTGSTILLYVNGSKQEEILVGREGTFIFPKARLRSGENEIYAISKFEDKQSQPSRSFVVSYLNTPPKLEVTKPVNNSTAKEMGLVIEGKTDQDVEITINDRFVYTDPNGNFSTTYNLSKGENTLVIKATDTAGNSSQQEFKVTYEEE